MLTHCPSCKKPLLLSPDQTERLSQALAQLAPGKLLSLKCPICRATISLDKNGSTPKYQSHQVQPPPPPKLDWLEIGFYQDADKVEDVPMAMVIHQGNEQRKTIEAALESVGYQVVTADTVADALEGMQFVNFACIVLQADLEGSLEQSSFHAHMHKLAMDRRRYVFYILIGDQFHTLYNLEALAYSANLTVNSDDLRHLDVILRKGIPAYEELFGPILEEMGVYGKR
ncbi:MAG: hypothetical protein FWG62_02415 [Proteobacteria bacterium]|nr:hypothetical protein [Pseudomonadota bacterium]